MIHSRTPSPTKSPRRQALSSKDSNVRQSPLLKPLTANSTPRLSPQRVVKPQSKSPSISPKKLSPTKLNSVFTKPTPQLGFKIFEDSTDYSTEIQLASTLAISDENDVDNNKENMAPRSPIVSGVQRTVLGELNITDTPGFITYHSQNATGLLDPRRGVYQLDTLWRLDGTREIPSYVTPPRKDRIKYISFTQDKVKMKRSNSSSDLKEKVVKKLVFGIHKD